MSPCCAIFAALDYTNDKSNRVVPTCNNLTSAALKPRLVTISHLPLYTGHVLTFECYCCTTHSWDSNNNFFVERRAFSKGTKFIRQSLQVKRLQSIKSFGFRRGLLSRPFLKGLGWYRPGFSHGEPLRKPQEALRRNMKNTEALCQKKQVLVLQLFHRKKEKTMRKITLQKTAENHKKTALARPRRPTDACVSVAPQRPGALARAQNAPEKPQRKTSGNKHPKNAHPLKKSAKPNKHPLKRRWNKSPNHASLASTASPGLGSSAVAGSSFFRWFKPMSYWNTLEKQRRSDYKKTTLLETPTSPPHVQLWEGMQSKPYKNLEHSQGQTRPSSATLEGRTLKPQKAYKTLEQTRKMFQQHEQWYQTRNNQKRTIMFSIKTAQNVFQ